MSYQYETVQIRPPPPPPLLLISSLQVLEGSNEVSQPSLIQVKQAHKGWVDQ